MMGVSRHRAIGVDTENVTRSPASMEMAEHFCSRNEIAQLRSELDENRRSERLLDFWTLKEAYVKARGMGLSIPLNQISLSLPGSRGIEIAFDGSVHDHRDNWHSGCCARHPITNPLCASRDRRYNSGTCGAPAPSLW